MNWDAEASPVPTNIVSGASSIAAGYYHSLAVKDGRVWAWGNNADGQLTMPGSALSGVSNVAGGMRFSMALGTNGSVVAWGTGSVTNVPPGAQSGVKQIAAGESHALALRTNGEVVAWGDNAYGQTNVPASLTSGVKAVSAGGYYSMALKTNGAVEIFGIDASSGLANGIRTIPALATSGVSAISAGHWHALALRTNGEVVAWGATNFIDPTNYLPPAVTSGVQAISAGYLFSMAIKTNGQVVVWGEAINGQVPVPNYASNGVVQIAAGYGHCLVNGSNMPPRFLADQLPDAYLDFDYNPNPPGTNAWVYAAGDPAVRYYSFGSWPAWMTLDATNGALYGTPSALGVSTFTIVASNFYGRTTNTYHVNVLERPKGPPVFITTNPLPDGVVGAPYSQQLVASNGASFSLVPGEGNLPDGLTLGSSGLIGGTPTAVQDMFFMVSATNLIGSSNKVYNLSIKAPAGPPVFYTTNPLPSGLVGQPYSEQIVVSNYPTGMGLFSGAFPAGLGMTSAGLVTGTPTQVGTANFTVFATNIVGASNCTYSLQIFGPPEFTTDSLPNGSLGVPYSEQILATGDALFSLDGGALPGGLVLATNGLVSGTPTAWGFFNFTVRATNAYGWSNRVFNLTIEDVGLPAFYTTNPLPSGLVGAAYSKQIVASGSPVFSLFAGALPGGFSLATNGWLTGTPTNTGAFEFTVRATNDYGWSNRTYNLQVFGPPVFATESPLPIGVVGQPYSVQIEAAEGPTFSVFSGSLPDGLALGAAGWLSGTPTNQGLFSFTVRATNGYGWSNRVFDLAVNARTLALLSRAAVNVRENGEGRFYVVLDESPAVPTTVTVARIAGDADLSVQSGAELVFTAANWNKWTNTVTLSAANDADATNGTATFQVTAPGGSTNLAATELDDDIGANKALASAGSTISGTNAFAMNKAIDGIHLSSTNYAYMSWSNSGAMTLDLKEAVTLSRTRLLNYDWQLRVQKYRIEDSLDGTNWNLLVTADSADSKGWDDWPLEAVSARYLRITGLTNSTSPSVSIAEWEVYGAGPDLLPPWFTDRPRYTNGTVRLAWTNPNGGSVEIWRATNITRNPVSWTNLDTTISSPWTNESPLMPSYYQLRLP